MCVRMCVCVCFEGIYRAYRQGELPRAGLIRDQRTELSVCVCVCVCVSQVLRDNYNPSSWVNLEWLNMIFNVLRHHKPRIFAHISDVRRLEDRRAQEEALRSRLPTA